MSIGAFTTESEVDSAIEAVKEIASIKNWNRPSKVDEYWLCYFGIDF
jgi:hypothetical protein